MDPEQMYEIVLLALCAWREAQNQPNDAILGVMWSVRNRVLSPGWWGNDWVSVILMPLQYSSFNRTDPNATKVPHNTSPVWSTCLALAKTVWYGQGPDPSQGATHYFDRSLDSNPPQWSTEMVKTVDLGSFHFYRKT